MHIIDLFLHICMGNNIKFFNIYLLIFCCTILISEQYQMRKQPFL